MMKKGFSLIEILVVIAVFAIIGLVTSQSVLTTLRGARRTDSDNLVRQNLDYSLSVMDRQLRSAQSIVSCTPERIDFKDTDGIAQYFTRYISGPIGTVVFSDNSNKITNADVDVSALEFVCVSGNGKTGDQITINITGTDANNTGIEASKISDSILVTLRSVQ